MPRPPSIAALASLGWLLSGFPAFAQGPLTPSAAPGPVMKSLDQIEPRTPIPGGSVSAPFVISQPGSYVLTGNLTLTATVDAIQVQTDNVTIDLGGFTITSASGTALGSGVLINGARKNVTVRNGNIVGGTTLSGTTYTTAGFFNGIFASAGCRNLLFERLSISNVRRGICDNGEIDGNASSTVRSCSVSTTAGDAIIATLVTDSTVIDASNFGINAITVSNCVSRIVCNVAGVVAISATTVENSRGANTIGAGYGVRCKTALNSVGQSDTGIGLNADTASYCRGESNTGTGLTADIAVACTGTSISATNRYLMP